MKKSILPLILFGFVVACNTSQIKDSYKNEIASEELDTTHLNTTIEEPPPILDSSAHPKQNFLRSMLKPLGPMGWTPLCLSPLPMKLKTGAM